MPAKRGNCQKGERGGRLWPLIAAGGEGGRHEGDPLAKKEEALLLERECSRKLFRGEGGVRFASRKRGGLSAHPRYRRFMREG